MKYRILVLSGLLAAVLGLSNFTVVFDSAKSFHTPEELEVLKHSMQVPIGPGQYFQTSASCKGCHGYDSLQYANVDENGADVNLFDRWEGSMMAMSAKDPLWRAKVSHEILVNPAHAGALQSKCTSCHAPMGHYNAFYHGATSYTLNDLVNDSLGLDGVSCAGCHTISADVGNTFSGMIPYDTTRQIYGPFPGPLVGPMQLYVGYIPNYAPHTEESSFCSPCHTLITETADLSGNLTGGTFIEQATYHEYQNSVYAGTPTTCQSCHMPRLTDPIIIANGFSSIQPRYPFNQHKFSGGNAFMLNLIRSNTTSLGISTPVSHIDSSIASTLEMLQTKSVEFQLTSNGILQDTAFFTVRIKNKAGHKFPSGYPARRAVLQLIMTDAQGDTVFQSGVFDQNYRVVGETASYLPHQDVISQNNVSQIYEMVMGDVNGQFTSVLERADQLLKDNRIPPEGFSTSSGVYDTVKISQDALADADFNKVNGIEGSGTDLVHFAIPVAGLNGTISVHARLFYQSVPPKWLDHMFTFNSAEIDTFRNMYTAADKTPVLVASDSTTEVVSGISSFGLSNTDILVYPTATTTGTVYISVKNLNSQIRADVFAADGESVATYQLQIVQGKAEIRLPETKGIYIISVSIGKVRKSFRILRI